jgi:hypothetical protein
MVKFKYKTYRCEWQIQFINVDQYGYHTGVYKYIPFPTRDEAWDHMPQVAVKNEYTLQWHPKDEPSTYKVVSVVYKEVEISQ